MTTVPLINLVTSHTTFFIAISPLKMPPSPLQRRLVGRTGGKPPSPSCSFSCIPSYLYSPLSSTTSSTFLLLLLLSYLLSPSILSFSFASTLAGNLSSSPLPLWTNSSLESSIQQTTLLPIQHYHHSSPLPNSDASLDVIITTREGRRPTATESTAASSSSSTLSSASTSLFDQSKSLPSTNRRRSLPSSSSSFASSSLLSPSPALSALSLVHLHPEEKTYVVGVEGARSVLPCNVTAKGNDTIDLILWFRGAEEKALYSIDARRAPTMQRATKHFSGDEQLGGRAYIDLTTRPTGLIIESVKAEDAGEYKCRIDFRKSRSEYRAVHLDVYVPPKEVIIMDEFGQRLSDPVGPFNEAAHLNLICEAEGGNPRPILHWYKNGRLIDDTWSLTAQGIVRNELVLSRLERADQGALLTCQVLLNVSTPASLTGQSNDAKSTTTPSTSLHVLKSVFSLITLELNLRPLDVRIITVHRPLVAGQMVMINCESSGSKPPALLSWWRGAKRLEGAIEEVATDENRTVSTLQFVPSVEDNGRVLSCRADHSVLSDSALEDAWILNVLFTPQLSISFGAAIQHDAIREGSNVSFECHVAGNPPVGEIGWMFENARLVISGSGSREEGFIHRGSTAVVNAGTGVSVRENTLMIHSVRRRHAGRYRCVASNVQGEGHSEEILLKVQYAPVCKEEQRLLYGVAKREPIEVPCSVAADPAEGLTFRWMFNSSSIDDNVGHSNSATLLPLKTYRQPVAPAMSTSVATYTPLTKHGYGQLLCWASNALGEQVEPCIFTVIPAAQPQPLRNCLVRNQSTDGLVVACEPGDDGGLEQHFFLEVFQAEQGQLWANLSLTSEQQPSSNVVEFTVTGIPVSTTYVLVLYAANAKGRSNYVTLSANTVPPGCCRGSEFLKFTADIGIKPLMYILAIVVAGLVVAAIAIVTISRARTINRGKGRHEPLPMSNSKQGKLSSSGSNNGGGSPRHMMNLDDQDDQRTLPLPKMSAVDNNGDPMSMQMYDLATTMHHQQHQHQQLPGPSGLPGLDLFENTEIMTTSSSLYDDHSSSNNNCQLGPSSYMNPIYISSGGKTVYTAAAASLLGDVTSTATPTSPSTHSSSTQQLISSSGGSGTSGSVIIKNPMAMHDAGPPLYHSMYGNFATTTAADGSSSSASPWKPPLELRQQSSEDSGGGLLLMDVSSYYGGVGDAISGSPSRAALLNSSNAISVPFLHSHHHHPHNFHPHQQQAYPPTAGGAVHDLTVLTAAGGTTTHTAIPYLEQQQSANSRFYASAASSQSPSHHPTIIFETATMPVDSILLSKSPPAKPPDDNAGGSTAAASKRNICSTSAEVILSTPV